MPQKMTKEQQAEYDSLDKAGKIRFTMKLRADQAAARGEKNPFGYQKAALAKARAVRKAMAEQSKALAKSVASGEAVPIGPKAAPAQGALSIKDMRVAVQELLAKHGINPIAELLMMAKKTGKGALPVKERKDIFKFLTPYIAPTLKAVDVQQETKMSVTVNIQSYAGASQEALKAKAAEIDKSEYAEFEQEFDEDQTLLEPEGGAEALQD